MEKNELSPHRIKLMKALVAGSWNLLSWRRILEDGSIILPFGEDVTGILIYAHDHAMAVQMLVKDRPKLDTTDALGGTTEERAGAYSTCLAYFGTYEVEDGQIAHHVNGSLFPNWSGTLQNRPFELDGETLVLRTPPTGGVVNEISWVRNRPETHC